MATHKSLPGTGRNAARQGAGGAMITVLLVDDDAAIRRTLGIRLGLEPDLLIAGEADTGAAALALAESLQPAVVLMDVQMVGMDGITTAELIRARVPATRVVMLTLYDETLLSNRARAAGASAFVAKHERVDVLLAAIRQAAGEAAAPLD
jgi:DNA-binding NarL/FixJ family response regulator